MSERPQMKDSDHELQGRDPDLYYSLRKHHYRDDGIASGYDNLRFGGRRARRNAAKWRAVKGALDHAGNVQTILDIPTGTGRFVAHLANEGYTVVGSDISREMMLVGREKVGKLDESRISFAQCDGERLPFRDGTFDCVMTIRFLFHLTPEARVNVLREFGRVTRRWVLADYRHRYSLRYLKQAAGHRLGLRGPVEPRVSRTEMNRELDAAGLQVCRVFRIAPLFSDKWVVLCERG